MAGLLRDAHDCRYSFILLQKSPARGNTPPSRHSPRLLEGGPHRPPFCAFSHSGRTILTSDDSDAPQHHIGLEARIQAAIELTITHMGYEIVRVSVLGRDQPTVQVMADRADGSLIGIDDCQVISETVSAALDVADVIKTRWTLEVSSAGIDRPLTRVKDWNRFAGHQARAEVNMPVNGRKRFTGIVLGADATTARMRLDDGTDVALPLADLRRAKLLLTDELIAATAHLKQAAPGDETTDPTLN